jgi:hypothetical protein
MPSTNIYYIYIWVYYAMSFSCRVVSTYLRKWQFIKERRKLVNTWKVNAKERNGTKEEDNVKWWVKVGMVKSEWKSIAGQRLSTALLPRSWRTFAWRVCQKTWKPEWSIARGRFAKRVSVTMGRCRRIDTRRIQQTNRSGECSVSGLHQVMKGHLIHSQEGFVRRIRKTDVTRASQSQWKTLVVLEGVKRVFGSHRLWAVINYCN